MLESDEFMNAFTAELDKFFVVDEKLLILVEYLHCPDRSISSENLKKHVRSFYVTAERCEIPHLRDLCRNELISSLNSSNALNILELAQTPFDKALNDAAFASIKTNISVIVNSDEFKLFVANHPNLAVEIMKASLTQRTSNKKICGISCLHCQGQP